MLLAKGTSGFFPPDNTDMDMHKHGQRAMQAEKTEWKNSLKFMYCERRDIYNVRILEADQYKIKIRLKGTVHTKITILSLFTHPLVISNLYEFLSSAELERKEFEKHFSCCFLCKYIALKASKFSKKYLVHTNVLMSHDNFVWENNLI